VYRAGNDKTMSYEVRVIETTTHGRVLVRPPARTPVRVVLGFHGYAENAAIQMERLAQLRGVHHDWMLVSIQGLHRFYRGRTDTVVAGWMTREDRLEAIADNIGYVDRVVETLDLNRDVPIVCAGFSQGVATAFRWGVRGSGACAGVIAAGGDVPPELLADSSAVFPPTLLIRGRTDHWYTQVKMDADADALRSRGTAVETLTLEGGHEWTSELSGRAASFIDAAGSSVRAGSRLPPPSAIS
jgi:predicted esterase